MGHERRPTPHERPDSVLMDDLAELIDQHRAEPFPSSVTKGIEYGEVDPVLIGADICGWALTVARGGSLSVVDAGCLRRACDDLVGSLDTFPDQARPYYERLLRIADHVLCGPPITA